jgi:Kef-type K+ transport system membrane component KefB
LSLLGASIDDAAAWCFLAVIVAVHAGHGRADGVRTVGLAAVFTVAMLTVVRRLLKPLGRSVEHSGRLGFNGLYIVLIIVVLAGYFTDYIGIYSVFGGFVAGLAMPKSPAFRRALHDRMMDLVSVLLLPTFFTFSGLNTELGGLTGSSAVLQLAVILSAGFVGKYVGCALGMRTVRFSWRESFAVGSLMNARGLMILIFINIGLAQHLITSQVFALLVLVAVITTAAAVPLYQLSIPPSLEARILAEAGDAPAPVPDRTMADPPPPRADAAPIGG